MAERCVLKYEKTDYKNINKVKNEINKLTNNISLSDMRMVFDNIKERIKK